MKEIVTDILILASPQKVWAILTDFASYPQWNPFIKSITGTVRVGETIVVRIEPPGASGMTLKPIVQVFNPETEFRWLGHLLFPGLFDGEHRFELADNADGSTTFRHCEKFKGILIPFFGKLLDVNTRNGFHEMNHALKERAEQK